MKIKIKFVFNFLLVTSFNLLVISCNASDDAGAGSCSIRGAEKFKSGLPCPVHEGKTVSSTVERDGRYGHYHFGDISTVYWLDQTKLRGTK